MPNTITLKRSSVVDSVPLSGNLEYGELALNYADGNLFYKNAGNSVVVIASNKSLTLSGNLTAGNLVTGGEINTVDLIASGLVDLGQVGNVKISGGSSGQVLSTDGTGNLSFTDAGSGSEFASFIHILNRDTSETSVGISMPVYASIREYFVYNQAGDAVALPTFTS